MSFWREVFSDENNRGSSQRVLNAVGVAIGSIVVLYLAFIDKLSEGIFATFVLATGGVYSINDWKKKQVEIERIRAENPAPAIAPVVTIPPPAPVNNFNIGGQSAPDQTIKDANLNVQGDVNNVANRPN